MIPLANYVILTEVKKENDTGIILPDNADMPESDKGKVVSVGSECKLDIKVGDVVLLKRHGFEELEVNKVKYLIGQEVHLIAKE